MPDSTSPPSPPTDKTCFICGWSFGVPFNPKDRYPQEACGRCIAEAVDDHGRALRFVNTTPLGGGFASIHVDSGERGDVHECVIRGVRCVANEAYMGGIAVVPRR